MNRYLIIGSAPYVSEWINLYLEYFEKRNYKIICFNNSWKAGVPLDMIDEWHHSNNHGTAGTYKPTISELKCFGTSIHHYNNGGLRDLYLRFRRGGTMFFNVMYSLLSRAEEPSQFVVVGCDFIYEKFDDTFYSDRPESKAAADPLLRYTPEELTEEAQHCYCLFESATKGPHFVLNASQYESLLGWPRFTDHLL